MKKVRICLAFCMILTLLFGACGTAQTGTQPTSAPEATEAPDMTAPVDDEEKITETPVPTEEVTKVTEKPQLTEAPTITKEPENTVTPATTDAPEKAETPTDTPKATATPKPTVTPRPKTTPYPKADSKKGDICYTAEDLKVLASWGVDCEPKSGSIGLEYTGQYGWVRFALPEAVDSGECVGVKIKMKAGTNYMGVSFYEEGIINNPNSWNMQSYETFPLVQEGLEQHVFMIPDFGYFYGMGLMYTGDVRETGTFKAELESITFYMKTDNEVSIPKAIAPDVTEDMTLLNTYGKLLGKTGTCATLAELKNPAVLQAMKEQYNSITSECEVQQNYIMVDPVSLVSVAEAKKLGYVIPANYKEEKVPLFDFSGLDETLKICAENNLSYRFHALMWHGQSLDWFFREGYTENGAYVSPKVMDARMEFYIRTVMEHVYNGEYGHIVYSWHVMNEHMHADETNSPWVRVYREDVYKPRFLKLAYEIADDVLRKHGVRDKVELVFNEYNTYLTENGRELSEDMIAVVDYLNSDKKVCDTIGMQCHIRTDVPIAGKLKKTILAFLDAGYNVQITEADAQIIDFTNGKEEQERLFCEFFKTILEVAEERDGLNGLIFWGSGDFQSWLKETTPLLFSHTGRPKEVYFKVLQLYKDPDSFILQEPVELTYDCSELEYLTSYGTDYTVNSDGSLDVAFQGQYNEVKFILPDEIDMSQCEYVTVKVKSEYADTSVKFYGKELKEDVWCRELFANWNCKGKGALKYDIYPGVEDVAYGIGFMSLNEAEDYSKYKATIYSVTFHMKPGYQAE